MLSSLSTEVSKVLKLSEQVLEHCIYINLDSRTDRKEHVINELKKIGINSPTRLSAIKHEYSPFGCSMSHIKSLETAIANKYEYVFIVEDDITFLQPDVLLKSLETFLSNNTKWDVIIIGGNNYIPYIKENDYSIKVLNCQTTTGYIVRREYYDTLLVNFKEGLSKFMEDVNKHYLYCIDTNWKVLQRKDNWYLILPLTVIQKADYSDIQQKCMDYSDLMLNYCKQY